jgi:hypothetical protein
MGTRALAVLLAAAACAGELQRKGSRWSSGFSGGEPRAGRGPGAPAPRGPRSLLRFRRRRRCRSAQPAAAGGARAPSPLPLTAAPPPSPALLPAAAAQDGGCELSISFQPDGVRNVPYGWTARGQAGLKPGANTDPSVLSPIKLAAKPVPTINVVPVHPLIGPTPACVQACLPPKPPTARRLSQFFDGSGGDAPEVPPGGAADPAAAAEAAAAKAAEAAAAAAALGGAAQAEHSPEGWVPMTGGSHDAHSGPVIILEQAPDNSQQQPAAAAPAAAAPAPAAPAPAPAASAPAAPAPAPAAAAPAPVAAAPAEPAGESLSLEAAPKGRAPAPAPAPGPAPAPAAEPAPAAAPAAADDGAAPAPVEDQEPDPAPCGSPTDAGNLVKDAHAAMWTLQWSLDGGKVTEIGPIKGATPAVIKLNMLDKVEKVRPGGGAAGIDSSGRKELAWRRAAARRPQSSYGAAEGSCRRVVGRYGGQQRTAHAAEALRCPSQHALNATLSPPGRPLGRPAAHHQGLERDRQRHQAATPPRGHPQAPHRVHARRPLRRARPDRPARAAGAGAAAQGARAAGEPHRRAQARG